MMPSCPQKSSWRNLPLSMYVTWSYIVQTEEIATGDHEEDNHARNSIYREVLRNSAHRLEASVRVVGKATGLRPFELIKQQKRIQIAQLCVNVQWRCAERTMKRLALDVDKDPQCSLMKRETRWLSTYLGASNTSAHSSAQSLILLNTENRFYHFTRRHCDVSWLKLERRRRHRLKHWRLQQRTQRWVDNNSK